MTACRQKKTPRLLLFLLLLLLPGKPACGATTVGVLMTGNSPYYNAMHDAFVAALTNRLPAGSTVKFLVQRPFPDPLAMANAARKLAAAEADIIVTYGSPATIAVLHERTGIRQVYAGVYDPEGIDLQGKNITGCGYRIPLSSLLRYLKSWRPLASLAVLYSSLEEDTVRQSRELAEIAGRQQITVHAFDVRSPRELPGPAVRTGADACFITGSAVIASGLDGLLAALTERKTPSASLLPDTAELGVTITLFQNPAAQGEKAAELAAHLLAGSSPEKMKPVVLSDNELEFNQREAQRMGLAIPITLISEATRVIK